MDARGAGAFVVVGDAEGAQVDQTAVLDQGAAGDAGIVQAPVLTLADRREGRDLGAGDSR